MTLIPTTPRRGLAPTLQGAVGPSVGATVGSAPRPIGTAVFPLHPSSDGRYLVDFNGMPFHILGDTVWLLASNLSVANMETLIADRAAKGLNTIFFAAFGDSYIYGANRATFDGISAFTSYPTLSSTNEPYWQRVDAAVSLCTKYGILAMICPFNMPTSASDLTSQGANACYSYGAWLGKRYKGYDNIIWWHGNDFGDDSSTAAVIKQMAQGLKDYAPNHLQTVEFNFYRSSSTDDTTWFPLLNLSAVYDYASTYDSMGSREYNRTVVSNGTPRTPYFLTEAGYEAESNEGYTVTPLICRKQTWWAFLGGGSGQLFGTHDIASTDASWSTSLNTTGAQDYSQFCAFVKTVPWWLIVPDPSHSVCTAGFGTYDSSVGNPPTQPNTNTYASTALLSDGSMILTYTPNGKTLTYDTTKLTAGGSNCMIRKMDPTTGAYTTINASVARTSSQSVTISGNNSRGNPDWLVRLDAI